LLFSFAAFGCSPSSRATPPPSTATTAGSPAGTERHVYRFDFVLTSIDGANPASSTSFTLNLEELHKGEMLIGKNVPLVSFPAAGGGSGPSLAAPRQDVGMKIAAGFRTAGDDVVLDVDTEMSAFEPPSSVRKIVSKGSVLASSGKSALVTTLDNDNKRYQLTVTPTKLR
jgi:hypothetical protein